MGSGAGTVSNHKLMGRPLKITPHLEQGRPHRVGSPPPSFTREISSSRPTPRAQTEGVRVADPPPGGERSAAAQRRRRPGPLFRGHESPLAFVDDTGIEPVTSSVSGKRATAAPIVQDLTRVFEVETGFEPVYTALQAVASPLGHSTSEKAGLPNPLRADDRVRTGDLNLGKVALYQLSYVRIATGLFVSPGARRTLAHLRRSSKTGVTRTSTHRHRPVTFGPPGVCRHPLRTKVFRRKEHPWYLAERRPAGRRGGGLAAGPRTDHR